MKATTVTLCALLLILGCNTHTPPPAAKWTEPTEVLHRDLTVVSYRAKLDGAMLVVEATHAPEWHTYALDNVERARKASGRDTPDTELPTRIEISGGLRVVGNWYQSEPTDLSQTEIYWYTWGFEDVAQFAARVERIEGAEATVLINGQACDAASCSMVDGAAVLLPLPSKEQFATNAEGAPVDLSRFVEAPISDTDTSVSE
mgnify:CR=1 FL=1|jgi:hypothetical protein